MTKILLALLMILSVCQALPVWAIALDAFERGFLSTTAPVTQNGGRYTFSNTNLSVCISNGYTDPGMQKEFNSLVTGAYQGLSNGIDHSDIYQLDLGISYITQLVWDA